MFRERVLPYLIKYVYRAIYFTWRLKVIEAPEVTRAIKNNEPLCFAHWHGDELAILWMLEPYRCCVMTSTSKDGELMDSTLRLMGTKTSRGSSTRGGVSALKGILRLSKEGYRPSVAVDGPKGPYHKVKPGIFEISRITGGMISAAGCSVSNAFVFKKAWNKTYLPLPFSKVVIVLDFDRVGVSRDLDPHDPALAEHLEQTLRACGRHGGQCFKSGPQLTASFLNHRVNADHVAFGVDHERNKSVGPNRRLILVNLCSELRGSFHFNRAVFAREINDRTCSAGREAWHLNESSSASIMSHVRRERPHF